MPTLCLKPLTTPATLLLAALVVAATPALALYKVVGPDGKITYTDRAPIEPGARVTELRRDAAGNATGNATSIATGKATANAAGTAAAVTGEDLQLPLDLRQVAARFPVTLYAAADCPPCDDARRLLQQRGVPFSEKRIQSDDDGAALERLVGSRTIPAATVGAQALRGFSAADWSSYLDAANYPRESRLPRGWRAPAVTPLVARAAPPAPAPVAELAPPPQPAPAARGDAERPPQTGIKF